MSYDIQFYFYIKVYTSDKVLLDTYTTQRASNKIFWYIYVLVKKGQYDTGLWGWGTDKNTGRFLKNEFLGK